MRRRLMAVMVLLAVAGWGLPRRADPDVERGTAALARGDAGAALDHYRAALGRGDRPAVHHDIGVARFRLAMAASEPRRHDLLAAAARAFRAAARTTDGALRNRATYNLGNTMLAMGHLEEAIECYRRVLIADPRSERARANLELALRRKGEGSPPARDGQKTSPAIRGQETGPIAPAAAKLEALERLSRDKWLEAQRASWRLRRPAAGSVDR